MFPSSPNNSLFLPFNLPHLLFFVTIRSAGHLIPSTARKAWSAQSSEGGILLQKLAHDMAQDGGEALFKVGWILHPSDYIEGGYLQIV